MIADGPVAETGERPDPCQRVTIVNVKGLHARAASALARCAGEFEADITVRHRACVADASSIMDLLMLAASCGTEIEVSAHGPKSAEAVAAIVSLTRNRFGESE